jgi:CBS domain containing-hemolysin-like protein
MILAVVLLILIAIDVITTLYAVYCLGLEEGNYLISWLPSEIVGVLKLSLGVLILFLNIEFLKHYPKEIELAFTAVIVIYSCAVLNNIVKIMKEVLEWKR